MPPKAFYYPLWNTLTSRPRTLLTGLLAMLFLLFAIPISAMASFNAGLIHAPLKNASPSLSPKIWASGTFQKGSQLPSNTLLPLQEIKTLTRPSKINSAQALHQVMTTMAPLQRLYSYRFNAKESAQLTTSSKPKTFKIFSLNHQPTDMLLPKLKALYPQLQFQVISSQQIAAQGPDSHIKLLLNQWNQLDAYLPNIYIHIKSPHTTKIKKFTTLSGHVLEFQLPNGEEFHLIPHQLKNGHFLCEIEYKNKEGKTTFKQTAVRLNQGIHYTTPHGKIMLTSILEERS